MLLSSKLFSVLLVVVFGGAGIAHGAPVFVDNPGFESQAHGPNTFIFGAPIGWSGYNTDVVDGDTIGTLNPHTTMYFAPGQWGGSNVGVAFMQSGGTADVEFGIRQTLAATLQANTIYTLTVAVGNIASGTSDLGGGPVFFDLDGFPGYRIELLAGSTLLAADVNTLASGGSTIPEGEFRDSQVVFDSTGVASELLGQQLTVGLVNLNISDPVDPGADREVDFDDVSLDAAVVPLPGALLLFGSVAGVLVCRRR